MSDLSVSLLPYRQVLALPGVRTSLLLMFVARIPMTAMGITVTLHVVTELGRGYGAAGLVATMATAGTAAGAPLLGRMLDHYGLRPVIAACAVASTLYWFAAPWLTYGVLLVVALPAGVLSVPSGSLAKQVLAALVPEAQRRTAYSLDSMSVEVSFMVGPAGALLLATQVSTAAALTAIGVAYAVVGLALCWTNPPLRSDRDDRGAAARPAMRSWFTPQLGKALLVIAGALFVLVGMEMALLAALRESGDVQWTSLVMVIICAASIAGGLVHGAVRRSWSQMRLMVVLAVLTLPVGLADHPWWLLALALIPMNLACAPTIAATSEAVTALAPARVRGEAIGLQGTALWVGIATGSPAIGFVIDHSSAAWGFAAAGAGGLAVAGVAYLLGRRAPRHELTVGAPRVVPSDAAG